jgi:hypothetical protein
LIDRNDVLHTTITITTATMMSTTAAAAAVKGTIQWLFDLSV